MGDREDKVYKAKLAEQAERYDGGFHLLLPRQFPLLLPPSRPPTPPLSSSFTCLLVAQPSSSTLPQIATIHSISTFLSMHYSHGRQVANNLQP